MEKKETKILVPVDFSDKSKEGIYQAIQLSKVSDAKIYLLHIIRENLPPWNFMNENEINNQILNIEQALINEAEKLTDKNPPKFSSIVRKGKLCDTILEEAEKQEVQLVVMGTSTEDNIKKKVIGSNALRIVTEAKVPVITVKKGCASQNINKIILPLDLTKETREKVTDAVRLARLYQAKILAVSFASTHDEGVVGHLKSQLNQVQEFIEKEGIEFEANFRFYKEGDRIDKVLEFVQEKSGDLIVITTHQQPEIVRFFLGSFAQEVIHGAPTPVLSIVPKGTFKVLSKIPGIS